MLTGVTELTGLTGLTGLTTSLASAVTSVRVLGRAGVIRPYSPLTLARLAGTLRAWGTGPAGGFATLALREPDRVGLVDELGELTFRDLHERSNALARALRARGVGEGDSVAIMCRNHRGFVDASLAVAKLGADALYLNTAFAGPQLVEVLDRDRPAMLVHDHEFTGLVGEATVPQRLLAWVDGDTGDDIATIESLIEDGDPSDLPAPQRRGRIVILTSGTTGTPKGAPRGEAGLEAAVSLLGAIPLRFGGRTHLAAPLFHTWGFAHLALGMLLGSTAVLRRRFDPEDFLDVLERERCDAAVVIPVMLQRVLALPTATLDRRDLSRVRVVASSGSSLPGDLAPTWMDRFGDHLYSVYGSTEVAYAAVAGPEDLRADPATAGRPPFATEVRLLDERGRAVPDGASGRIFVGNGLLFEGYTGGGHREVVDGLMCSGDVGRWDAGGRLRVEGRDDDMIVSGGENVFPQVVEDCLARHEAVAEAAALGVADDDFGTRLRAFVVVTADARGRDGLDDELKAWVRHRLARYQVPREIVFLDALPRTATGKVLKRELARSGAQEDDQR